MKLIRNTGTDRVIDLLRPQLTAGRQCDVVTSALSVFAFSELLHELAALERCRLVLPPAGADLAAVYGCLVYDDTLTPKAGVCYNYFGGTNSVTNGTFTIVWHANGVFRFTL